MTKKKRYCTFRVADTKWSDAFSKHGEGSPQEKQAWNRRSRLWERVATDIRSGGGFWTAPHC